MAGMKVNHTTFQKTPYSSFDDVKSTVFTFLI